jgi:hypothetical protein
MSDQSSEDIDLAFTQDVRRRLVNKLTENNSVPTETKEQAILLNALADMDRQALGVKKIKSDEGIGNKQVAAASILMQLFNDPNIKNVGRGQRSGDIPVLDSSIVPDNIVDGELETTASTESYDSFTKRLGMDQVWDKSTKSVSEE